MSNRPRHNFTLAPIASDMVKKTKEGYKSDMVSRAIIWFNRDVSELVADRDHWFDLACSHAQKIEELEHKLTESRGFWFKLFNK